MSTQGAIMQFNAAFSDKWLRQLQKTWQYADIHHFMSLGFVLIAWAFSIAPVDPVTIWMRDHTGFGPDILVVLFMLSAFIMACNPSKLWFVIAMLPLVLYLAVRAAHRIDTGGSSMTVIYYSAGNVILPLAMRFKGLRKMPLTRVYALVMLLVGMGTMQFPHVGTAQWLYDTYRIPGEALGLLITGCALVLAVNNTPRAIAYFSLPFGLYLIAATYYTFRHIGVPIGFIAGDLAVCSALIMTTRFGALQEHAEQKKERLAQVLNGSR